MINRDGFRAALKAALDGPEKKDVEWTKFGHDFNVKKAKISETGEGLTIDGGDGRHISHRKRFRPDDQLFYKCKVSKDGKVVDLEINIKSTADILKEWLKTAGEIVAIVSAILGAAKKDGEKADDLDTVEPVPSSLELLDGDWEGDAEFLVANIIAYATVRHMPELANKKPAVPVFTASLKLNRAVLADFEAARAKLVGS